MYFHGTQLIFTWDAFSVFHFSFLLSCFSFLVSHFLLPTLKYKNQQDRQLAKTCDILAIKFQSSLRVPKMLITCTTQTEDILMTQTTKVTNHDSREDT
jgi:hypothetical protein